jgi:cytochrome c oxidase subunit 2
MPITVKVVSQEAYDVWLAGAVDEYAENSIITDAPYDIALAQ